MGEEEEERGLTGQDWHLMEKGTPPPPQKHTAHVRHIVSYHWAGICCRKEGTENTVNTLLLSLEQVMGTQASPGHTPGGKQQQSLFLQQKREPGYLGRAGQYEGDR